jgi:hypothetical protein
VLIVLMRHRLVAHLGFKQKEPMPVPKSDQNSGRGIASWCLSPGDYGRLLLHSLWDRLRWVDLRLLSKAQWLAHGPGVRLSSVTQAIPAFLQNRLRTKMIATPKQASSRTSQ